VDEEIAACRPLEYEARFLRANGQVRVMHSRALPVVDGAGRLTRYVGMSQDVTERRREENRLRTSEALLDQAEEIAGFGCWEYDVASGGVLISKQLRKMYELDPDEPWDSDRYWNNVLGSDRDDLRRMVLEAIAECKPFEYVTRYRLSEGPVRVFHARGSPSGSADSGEHFRGVVHDITAQMHIEEELRRLSRDLMKTQDEERRQIARELHESAGQTLAALKMTLTNLEEALNEKDDGAEVHLRAARGLAEDAIREVRVLSYLMHPPMLDEVGLGPTLQWYGRGFSDRSNIQTTVEVDGEFGRLPQPIETTIFRIVQEALTNVHRYSGSKTVTIRLIREQDRALVEIIDRGCGLQSAAPGRNVRLGVGIAGMRERVKQLEGRFEIESAAGRGTTVRAILPLVMKETLPDFTFPTEQDGFESTKGE
jgi:signal transduction histidine kinase